MESIIQNYDEFLIKIRENASVDINYDVIFWDSFITKGMGELGIESIVGTNFEIETLKGFETKTGIPYCSRFAVTGTCDSNDNQDVVYITRVLAV